MISSNLPLTSSFTSLRGCGVSSIPLFSTSYTFTYMASSSGSTPAGWSSSNLTIAVEKNIPRSRFAELGINAWPKWACPPGKYMLKYDSTQTCYLVRGKVKVYPRDSSSAPVEFGAGDLAIIPKGLSCTWHVTASVDKHYKFEPSPAPPSPPSD